MATAQPSNVKPSPHPPANTRHIQTLGIRLRNTALELARLADVVDRLAKRDPAAPGGDVLLHAPTLLAGLDALDRQRREVLQSIEQVRDAAKRSASESAL